jgi:hypothetical protein
VIFRNKLIFLRWGVFSTTPHPKPEYHPLSAVRYCLFDTFAATHHIWRPSPPTATWGRHAVVTRDPLNMELFRYFY